MKLIYGPVQSLRYGHTLGVNLLGAQKVCSFDCSYCHLGPTVLTMNKARKEYEYPSLDQIRQAFRDYITQSVPTDAIVVSGNGEPTLYPAFDDAMKLIQELRQEHLPQTKIIVLSNGAHLDSKKVIVGLNIADERVIKIDAGNDAVLNQVNAPLIRMNMSKFLNNLNKLEDFVVQSLFVSGAKDNSSSEAIDEWIEVIGMIKPKAVQICTLTRPAPGNPNLKALDEDALYAIAFKLKKRTGLEASVFGDSKAG